MTPRQADAVIKADRPITVQNTKYGETFTATFVSRDRYDLYTDTGSVYDRGELTIISRT